MRYIFLLLILFSCHKKPQEQILNPNNFIVISLPDAQIFWDSQIKYNFIDTVKISFWTPNILDLTEAEISIRKHIIYEMENEANQFFKRQLIEIGKNFKQYKRQFVGLIVDNKKMIWCNYLLEDNQSFKTDFDKIVQDGGSAYWRIFFNVENKSCLNLQVNGES